MAKFFSNNEKEKIENESSVLDYFFLLEKKGLINFEKKSGKYLYFKNDSGRFSVTNDRYYNFNTREGGKIFKAIMQFENKSWYEAIEYANKELANNKIPQDIVERRNANKPKPASESSLSFTNVAPVNNSQLLGYFADRGISNETIKGFTKQVHYKIDDKKYFGIGIENVSNGYEVRNPLFKTKIGVNDVSVIKPEHYNGTVIFEGMTDMLSFIELQKLNGQANNKMLISLNSVTNVERLDKVLDQSKKIFLVLDGDQAGTETTEFLINKYAQSNIKDIRSLYSIGENFNDLNDYLKSRFNLSKKESQDEIRTNPVSHSFSKDVEQPGRNAEQNQIDSRESQSVNSIDGGGFDVHGENVGNGLAGTTGDRADRSNEQPNAPHSQSANDGEDSSRQFDVGISGRGLTENQKGAIDKESEIINDPVEIGTANSQSVSEEDWNEIERIVSKSKTEKIDNSDIERIVELLTYIDNTNVVMLKDNAKITDEIIDIANQFKSGGIKKEGRGILDEYYTNNEITSSVYNLVISNIKDKNNLKALEPSVGTGNFVKTFSTLFPNKIDFEAFEINRTSAGIAKLINPEAQINLISYESVFMNEKGIKRDWEKDKYDLVVGNPPYGSHRGLYKGLGEETNISRYEDYFVKRSLDQLKEGGVLAMVLPSAFIERQRKLNSAEIINAYRLPTGAFKGTEIGTDIIILKKNSLSVNNNISTYFRDNPHKVLGDIEQKTNRFGRLENYVKGNLQDALFKINEIENGKQQQIVIPDLFNYSEQVPESIKPTKQEIILDAQQKVDDVLTHLEKDIEILPTPLKLNTKNVYEQNKQALTNSDIGVDEAKKIGKRAKKIAEIYSSDGLYVVQKEPAISTKNLKYLFQKDDEIVNTSEQSRHHFEPELLQSFKDSHYDGILNNYESHIKYANLYKGEWIHDFYYAEGNIYEKLSQLELDFENKNEPFFQEQYQKQKAMLKSVLPTPKTLEDITISPNHEIVEMFQMGAVEKQVWNPNTRITENKMVEQSLADYFCDYVANLPSDVFEGSSSWEVRSYVRNEMVTGSDKERNALVRERRKEVANSLFSRFLREDMPKDKLNQFVDVFNKKFNSIHVPNYSQFPLFSQIHRNFKGSPLRLTEVQLAGTGRLTTKGVGLLAHEVGFGKTLSGILSLHEAMSRGNAKRPLIVVPNASILKQWVETIAEVIPNAKVNVLGNLGKDYNLENFSNYDNEITIVTYEGFNNIGFKDSVTQELAGKFSYISEIETKSLKNISERDMQIEIEKQKELEGKMRKGKLYDWEDFGFDHLTFDEVHNANHIVGKVKIEDRRFASDFRSQNQRTSGLGINTWMASQWIQKNNDGRNVTLLSATPFTNKPLEYYSVLSLVANKRLEESGYFNVNNFFETFMEADNDMEIDAKGEVKFKTNVRRFKNNALFQKLLSEFIDFKGEEDNPQLVRPNRINREYRVEQNALTKEQYDNLTANYSDRVPGAILTHILNARQTAISPYLSPYYVDEEPTIQEFVENSPKLYATMELIRQNKKDNSAGQIIYSELAVNQFPKLKEYLISNVGFKADEVETITGLTSKNKKIEIQNNFNEGKVKVVIGSEAIQEGMNLQEKTSDVYMLTLPYNFTDLRQVEGRAWRQGNQWENVRINYMLMDNSIDVFMLQKLQAKQMRYMESMKKGANIVDVSDINTQELKTAIITDPTIRANIEIELLKKKIESEKAKITADSAFFLRKNETFMKYKDEVSALQTTLKQYTEWAKEGDSKEFWTHSLVRAEHNLEEGKKRMEAYKSELKNKGVDVDEIEHHLNISQQKIDEKEDEIKLLPEKKEQLVEKYIEEQKNMKVKTISDYVQERLKENETFYKLRNEQESERRTSFAR